MEEVDPRDIKRLEDAINDRRAFQCGEEIRFFDYSWGFAGGSELTNSLTRAIQAYEALGRVRVTQESEEAFGAEWLRWTVTPTPRSISNSTADLARSTPEEASPSTNNPVGAPRERPALA